MHGTGCNELLASDLLLAGCCCRGGQPKYVCRAGAWGLFYGLMAIRLFGV